jgi:DNA excision repair protein ERCC-3
VTITTYAMVAKKGGEGPTKHQHFDRLSKEPWGLVIYDEVHLLPAPIFRLTAELQARRRLGLTATLVREDGREGDVFALIGPKRHDVPWRELEKTGHIATATCFEVRVPLPEALSLPYASADAREQPRIAGENPLKLSALRELAARHAGDRVLVLGSYLEPLTSAGRLLDAPVVTGETPHDKREEAYSLFRRGAIRTLVLSRVGNFAIDLPEANVLIQLSGTMGSRQEEAQRLGRVLRPKPGGATFYSLVTRDTVEQAHALHRQLFLTEQGYRYFIEEWSDGHGGEQGEGGEGRVLH